MTTGLKSGVVSGNQSPVMDSARHAARNGYLCSLVGFERKRANRRI